MTAAPAGNSAGFAEGVRLPLDALRLLRREPGLRAFALVPLLVSAAALALGVALVVGYAGELYYLATAWLPAVEAGAWYSWLWVGPAKLVLGVAGVLLFLVAAAACLVASFLVGSLVASPFHDVLSRRVEAAVSGGVVESSSPGIGGFLRDAAWVGLEEAKRLGSFLGVQAIAFAAGLVVPGAQLVTFPVMTALTILFLALDHASYALDRRGLSFRGKLAWSRRNLGAVAGYGAAAFLACSVPGLNVLAMPVLVTGGTLLVLRGSPVSPELDTRRP